jgi:hypothetical protein
MGNEDGSKIANLDENMGKISWTKTVLREGQFQEDRSPRSHGIEIPPLARTRVVRDNAMSCKGLAGFVFVEEVRCCLVRPIFLVAQDDVEYILISASIIFCCRKFRSKRF